MRRLALGGALAVGLVAVALVLGGQPLGFPGLGGGRSGGQDPTHGWDGNMTAMEGFLAGAGWRAISTNATTPPPPGNATEPSGPCRGPVRCP